MYLSHMVIIRGYFIVGDVLRKCGVFFILRTTYKLLSISFIVFISFVSSRYNRIRSSIRSIVFLFIIRSTATDLEKRR